MIAMVRLVDLVDLVLLILILHTERAECLPRSIKQTWFDF